VVLLPRDKKWCLGQAIAVIGQGAMWERDVRSVLHLENYDGNLCAVFKCDLHSFLCLLAQQCSTNGGDRTHDFNSHTVGALFFHMADEVLLSVVFAVAFKQDGDDGKNAHFIRGCGFGNLGVLKNAQHEVLPVVKHAVLVFGSVIVAVFLEVAHFAGTADFVGYFGENRVFEVSHLFFQPLICLFRQQVLRHAEKATCAFYDGLPMAHRIALIGGDGIGPEVTAEAVKVVRATGAAIDTTDFDLGGMRYLRDGEILSDDVLNQLRNFDAILLGAVGTPDVPPGIIERGLLLKMRFDLDLYVNQRPFAGTAPGHVTPHDFVVIRENTEGPYVGEGGVLRRGTPHEIATQGSVNTRHGVERCIRYAFELAAKRERKHVTLVHKTNVLTFAGDLWQRAFNHVAAEFPQVGTAYNHVDAACIYFVEDPHRYDVIVTDNLFGDILTDLGGAVSGGIGLASSANLNPSRTGPSMFEPSHGSAPDIVGTGKANPTAAILSAALMLEFLGENDAAARIRVACDTAPTGSTTEIGNAIAALVAGK